MESLDPHIHSPGTVLNDQFRGPNPWNGYLETLKGRKYPFTGVALLSGSMRFSPCTMFHNMA